MKSEVRSILFGVGASVIVLVLYFALKPVQVPPVDPFVKQREDSIKKYNDAQDIIIKEAEVRERQYKKTIDSLQKIKYKIVQSHEKIQASIRLLPAHPSAEAMRHIFAASGVDTAR